MNQGRTTIGLELEGITGCCVVADEVALTSDVLIVKINVSVFPLVLCCTNEVLANSRKAANIGRCAEERVAAVHVGGQHRSTEASG